MSRHRCLSFALALAVCATVLPALAEESAPVYEALFRQFGQPGLTYVVLEQPLEPKEVAPLEERIKGFDFPKDRDKHQLRDFGAISVRLLTNDAYAELFAQNRSCSEGWQAFHKRFPNKSLLKLSLVGFRNDGQEAAVILEGASACLGGSTDVLMFDKKNSRWRFRDSINIGRS